MSRHTVYGVDVKSSVVLSTSTVVLTEPSESGHLPKLPAFKMSK